MVPDSIARMKASVKNFAESESLDIVRPIVTVGYHNDP